MGIRPTTSLTFHIYNTHLSGRSKMNGKIISKETGKKLITHPTLASVQ